MCVIYREYYAVFFIICLLRSQANITWNWIRSLWTTTACTSVRWAWASAMNRPLGRGRQRWPCWCRRDIRGSCKVIWWSPPRIRRWSSSAARTEPNHRPRLVWPFWLSLWWLLLPFFFFFHWKYTNTKSNAVYAYVRYIRLVVGSKLRNLSERAILSFILLVSSNLMNTCELFDFGVIYFSVPSTVSVKQSGLHRLLVDFFRFKTHYEKLTKSGDSPDVIVYFITVFNNFTIIVI